MSDGHHAWRYVARAAAAVWFRDVEVIGRERLPADRPALLVASHFNGMLDAVLVAVTAPRMPRFLATSGLWRNPVVGRFLDSVGALPVYRSSEGSTARNSEIFAACYRALAAGEAVALFPEGTTHDEPRLAAVRTGAARIALGARAAGVRDLVIVPVGVVYGAKTRPRSRALVRVGPPIDLDAELDAYADPGEPATPDNTTAVRRLTEEIRARLADAALDYDHADTALAAAIAVAIALRPAGAPFDWEPGLDELERCARALVAAPVDLRVRVFEALAPYVDGLTLLGIRDADLVAGDLTPARLRLRLGGLATAVAAAPVGAVGAAVNAPGLAAVWAAGNLPLSTPMRATGRMLAGLVALPLSWVLLRQLLARRGWREPTLAALAAGPGAGLVALGLAERAWALGSARESARRLRDHAAVLPVLMEERAEVVAAVEAALAASTGRDQAAGEAG